MTSPVPPKPDPSLPPEEPYQEVTGPGYGASFVAGCSVDVTAVGVELVGDCPRCGHPMRWVVVDEERLGYRSATAISGPVQGTPAAPPTAPAATVPPPPAPADQDEPVICTCTATHPHRPPNRDGCGAGWNVQLG